jgi:S-formylglutathione hydrolase FrmB
VRSIGRTSGRRSRRWVAALAVIAVAIVASVVVTHFRVVNGRGYWSAPTRTSARSMLPGPGRTSVLAVRSADATGGRRLVWVYRPGVADTPALPVVYFLHGLPGSYRDLPDLGVARMLDDAFRTRRWPPFVVAAPDGNSPMAADTEWADSADGRLHLRTFVTGALISAVEGQHRRARRDRAIIGFSMGGYGAVNDALHRPDLFGAFAAIAGYFRPDDESAVFDGNPTIVTDNSPDRNVKRAVGMRALLAVGADDSTPVVAGQAQQFAGLLRTAGVTPQLDVISGGHDGSYLRAELPRAFAFLAQPWRRS